VCLTVIYFRVTNPKMERPFRTPLFPVVPILGALMCVGLLMSLMADIKTRYFFLWYLAIGIPVYFLYGIRKSALNANP
jgi:APA family basic amino acid/polyamine antiporter